MDYSKYEVLIVEDDLDVSRLIQRCLSEIPVRSQVVNSNEEARAALGRGGIGVVILDLGLPDGDGLMLARDIATQQKIGVIILSGRDELTDKVIGLEIGADDYITKPFEKRELNARVKGLIRRIAAIAEQAVSDAEQEPQHTVPSGSESVTFADWTLLKDRMQIVHADGRTHEMSVSEYQLLTLFLERAGRVLSRDQIMDYLFGSASPAYDRSVDVRISRLRAKLEDDPKHPTIIVTIRNLGYVFRGAISLS